MSLFTNATVLNWEWPADRLIKHKIIVELTDVVAQKKMLKSPSFAADLPDPVEITGKVIGGDFLGKVAKITLKLPKIELAEASMGSRVALAMIDEETVVCINLLPLNLKEQEGEAWLEKWECK